MKKNFEKVTGITVEECTKDFLKDVYAILKNDKEIWKMKNEVLIELEKRKKEGRK